MKKMLFFLCVSFFFICSFVYAESNLYSVNYTNFNKDDILYTDNLFTSSEITVVVNPYGQNMSNLLSYEDVYTQDYLNEYGGSILGIYEENFSGLNGFSSDLKFSCITDFNDYKCLFYLFHITQNGIIAYYNWYYTIFADNYCYIISLNSPDKEYINTNNANTFLNSFEIKDTTKLCTPSSVFSDNTVIGSNQANLPQMDYSIKSLSTNLIFTAIIYLFIPMAIRLMHKNGFESSTAFWISLFNFVMIKIILSVLLNANLNITSAWWYLFIGQAILTFKYKDKGNPYSRPLDEIIKDISNKDN